jgi:hypothetical protein
MKTSNELVSYCLHQKCLYCHSITCFISPLHGILSAKRVKYFGSLIVVQPSTTLFKYAHFLSHCNGTDLSSQLLLFQVIPTFIDIIVALVVFAIKLDWTLMLVIFVVLSTYSAFWKLCSLHGFMLKPYLVAASILLTRWRIWLRRAMNERDTVCPHMRSSRTHSRTMLLDHAWHPHRLSAELRDG